MAAPFSNNSMILFSNIFVGTFNICTGHGVLTCCVTETKRILHPFAIDKIFWVLVKTFSYLLKWEIPPVIGVTGKYIFINNPFTNSLFNRVTSGILLEKDSIWFTTFNSWLLEKPFSLSAVVVVILRSTFLLKRISYCLNFPIFPVIK